MSQQQCERKGNVQNTLRFLANKCWLESVITRPVQQKRPMYKNINMYCICRPAELCTWQANCWQQALATWGSPHDFKNEIFWLFPIISGSIPSHFRHDKHAFRYLKFYITGYGESRAHHENASRICNASKMCIKVKDVIFPTTNKSQTFWDLLNSPTCQKVETLNNTLLIKLCIWQHTDAIITTTRRPRLKHTQ